MFSVKLVHLIEQHSSELTDGLVKKLHTSPRTRGLQQVPAADLRKRVQEMLIEFHLWLITRGEDNGQAYCMKVGARHASDGIPLSDSCWAIVVVKEHLWDFVEQHAFYRGPSDLHAELELMRYINLFFDSMLCYVTDGYEQYQRTVPKPAEPRGKTGMRWFHPSHPS